MSQLLSSAELENIFNVAKKKQNKILRNVLVWTFNNLWIKMLFCSAPRRFCCRPIKVVLQWTRAIPPQKQKSNKQKKKQAWVILSRTQRGLEVHRWVLLCDLRGSELSPCCACFTLEFRTVVRSSAGRNDSVRSIFFCHCLVTVFTGGGSIKDSLIHLNSFSVCCSYFVILHDCILNIRIRINVYLIFLPCLWLKAIIIMTNIYLFFCTPYFPNGYLWSCPGFAASPFEKFI